MLLSKIILTLSKNQQSASLHSLLLDMQMTPSGKTAIVSSADGLYTYKNRGMTS